MKRWESRPSITATVLILFLFSFAICSGFLFAAEPKKDSKQLTPKYGGTMRIYNQTSDGVSIGYPAKLIRNSNRFAAPAVETLFRSDK